MEINSKYLKSLKSTVTQVVSADKLDSFKVGKKVVSTTKIEGTDSYAVVYNFYKAVSYENIVERMVEEKYPSAGDREGILRKGIFNKENKEFLDFYYYVEECKVLAEAFVNERDA